MNPLSSPVRRRLIRLAYLMPAISGLLLLLWGAIPHIWFLYENTAYDTQNIFTLVTKTFADCSALLNGTTEGSNYAMLFAYIMIVFAVLFWIGIFCYALMSLPFAVCSLYAFSYPPTSKEANRAKRWLRFFCPNRVIYVLSNLAILLSAAFPHILLYFYRTQLGYTNMSVHFFGPSDLLLALILVACNLSLFFALLSAQSTEHLDMYRLYKAKKNA